MSDNRSSSGNISGFIRTRERTHRHHNVQRSNVHHYIWFQARTRENTPSSQRSTFQRSTFQRSSLYLVSSAHEREHTVITTFNVPTFNLQRSTTQRPTFNLQPSTFNLQPSTFIPPHPQPHLQANPAPDLTCIPALSDPLRHHAPHCRQIKVHTASSPISEQIRTCC